MFSRTHCFELKVIQYFFRSVRSLSGAASLCFSLVVVLICPVIHSFVESLSDKVTGLMNHRSILWASSITILLSVFVCVIEISPTIPW